MFTDIEASTALWERSPEVMREALELHDGCMRALLEEHRGYEVRTEGDAFKVAFGSPVDAVRWAMAVQRRLMELAWPAGLAELPEAGDVTSADGSVVMRGLRVRIGGHTGYPTAEVHPTTGRMEYHGPMVNETARVAAAPSGGQVVVTAITWEAARRAGDLSDVVCEDLGRHRLKGVADPEHLLQLSAPELSARVFGGLRTESARQTNLQAPTDAFVGREGELEQVAEAFHGGARLVTLLGPGGTGKTRLATEYGLSHQFEYTEGGGVWRCDLEEATDVAGICSSIARALLLPMSQVADPTRAVEVLGRALSGMSPIFLVLDNLEQAVDPGRAALAAWLREAPQARFLVTSREPLGISGERRVELRGLQASDARKLFVDRVRHVRAGWEPGPDDESAIDDIARQLDYMPLALELAASRSNVLAPRAIAKRLSERFRLLKGSRGDDSRQGTLRATIDWSWNLLDEAERVALAQCSVFAGGFTMEGAEAVLDLDDIDRAPWPMDVVASLRQKSLLFSREVEGEVRLGQYQSIQAYARERLVESGQLEAITQRHAAHFADAASRWCAEMATPHEVDAFRKMGVEVDNLRAAYRASAGKDPAQACALAYSMARVMAPAGHGEWMERMVGDAVEAAGDLDDPALLARLLVQRGRLRHLAADPFQAVGFAREAVDVARAGSGLEAIEVEAWLSQALLAYYGESGREAARVALEEAGKAAAIAGDPVLRAVVRVHEAFSEADGDRAMALGRELRHLGAPLHSAWAFQAASICLMRLGRTAEARECMRSATRVWAPLRQRHDTFNAYSQLSMIDLLDGLDAAESIERAEAAILPVDAPGKHEAIRVLRAAQAVVDARAGKGDLERSTARARELVEQLRAPGPPGLPGPPGPGGAKSWVDRSAWVTGALVALETLLEA
jgi:predicted ATPase/class 3 adenylate cyclase